MQQVTLRIEVAGSAMTGNYMDDWRIEGVGQLPADLPMGTRIGSGYLMGTILDGGQTFGIIVSPKSGGDTSLTWGPSGDTLLRDPTNGQSNTSGLVLLPGKYPAAQFCAGLTIDGSSDWYLPAIEEMGALFQNRDSIPLEERLNNDWYWSSTEATAANASVIGFGAGAYSQSAKSAARRVRAIRRISL